MIETSVIKGAMASVLAVVGELYYPLRWLMLLAFVLIILDLRWGVAAARMRGEDVQFSRAGRRTINKMIDYFCWATVAGLIEAALFNKFSIQGIPIGQLLLMIFIFAFEIDSVYSNYCEARSIKKRWDILKWVSKKTSLEKVEQK